MVSERAFPFSIVCGQYCSILYCGAMCIVQGLINYMTLFGNYGCCPCCFIFAKKYFRVFICLLVPQTDFHIPKGGFLLVNFHVFLRPGEHFLQ